MRIKYLGTAAAEGFPAIFCNCEHCKAARELGGKNIRTRSQTLINDDLLIDFPQDTYHHFLEAGIRGDKIKYLFITHPHHDHFYPDDLLMRHGCYAHNMDVPVLRVFAPESAMEKLSGVDQGVLCTAAHPFEEIVLDSYSVTPLPARHMDGKSALIYLIKGEKTILYAHDTGYFYDDVFKYLEKNGIVLDMISLDCTNVDIPVPDSGGHMGFENISRVIDRLYSIGAITDKTVKYVNHFSHNGNPLHHILEKRAAEYSLLVSYDGCCVEL